MDGYTVLLCGHVVGMYNMCVCLYVGVYNMYNLFFPQCIAHSTRGCTGIHMCKVIVIPVSQTIEHTLQSSLTQFQCFFFQALCTLHAFTCYPFHCHSFSLMEHCVFLDQ